jgi:hypothetical protein
MRPLKGFALMTWHLASRGLRPAPMSPRANAMRPSI